MGQEADAKTYDAMHESAEEYLAPVGRSLYYPLFRRVAAEVRQRNVASVLEVGCGSGGLAQILLRETSVSYHGFDFSAAGVRNARERIRRPDLFRMGDALDPESYRAQHDAIVCTEVLEHITRDLDVIRLWREGTHCICTVPNFDYETHVRHFRHEDEVRERYGALIELDTIKRVAKPVFNVPIREYLRRLRWAREEPKRLLGLLGVNTFQWVAGWFLFAGRRR
jgi:SAM-dependent methyltransferase